MKRRLVIAAGLASVGSLALSSVTAASSTPLPRQPGPGVQGASVIVSSVTLAAGMPGVIHARVTGPSGHVVNEGSVLFQIGLPASRIYPAHNHLEPIVHGVASHTLLSRETDVSDTYQPVTAWYVAGPRKSWPHGTGFITITTVPPTVSVPPVTIVQGTTNAAVSAVLTMPPGVLAPSTFKVGKVEFRITDVRQTIIFADVFSTGSGLTRAVTLDLPKMMSPGTYVLHAWYSYVWSYNGASGATGSFTILPAKAGG